MASHKDLEDDEYVATLLAEDAKKSSMRYASMGLSALLPKRPTNSAPKPNTRFLKSIIRETDNHNAALKKKEELEARIRLRKLREENGDSRSSRHSEVRGGTKRRRLGDDDHDQRHRAHRREEGRLRNTSSERSRSRQRKYPKSSRRRMSPLKPGEESERHGRVKSDRRRRRSTSRGRGGSTGRAKSVEDVSYNRRRQRRRSRSTSESSDAKASRTDRRTQEQKSQRGEARSRSRSRSGEDRKLHNHLARSSKRHDANDEDEVGCRLSSRSSSSDPLEALVGPIPVGNSEAEDPHPVRPRGRGAYRPSGAAMDAHFSSNYDPKLDLRPESEAEDEKEDWDMALEALRDREMWKQKHAERLREAGFGDDDIKKWEDSGKEKDVEDVKWSKKGEAREWDVGKVTQNGSEEKPRGNNGFEEGWKRKGGGFLKTFKEALG